jgi:hypothetical protein
LAKSCVKSDEPLYCLRGGILPGQLMDYQLLKDSAPYIYAVSFNVSPNHVGCRLDKPPPNVSQVAIIRVSLTKASNSYHNCASTKNTIKLLHKEKPAYCSFKFLLQWKFIFVRPKSIALKL